MNARLARSLALAALLAGCGTFALAQPPKADDKAPKADPKAPKSEEDLAREDFVSGKGQSAVDHLKNAVKNKPELCSPELIMARWFFDLKKGPEARGLLEQAAARNPGHPSVYILNAFFAFNEGRVTDAMLSLQQAKTAAESGTWTASQRKEHFLPDIYSGLASAFERRNDWFSAREMLVSLNNEKEGNPQTLMRLARASFVLNQEGEAVRYLQEAYAKDKTLDLPELTVAQLWSQKGSAVERKPDAKQEEKDKEKAAIAADLKKNKDKAEEWFDKALKKYEPAKAAAGTNAEDKEKAAKACRAYALWFLENGQEKSALAQLETAKKLDPNSRETRTAAGIYDRYTGNLKDAIANFDEALRVSPSYAPALVNAALALIDQPSASKADQERALGYAQLYQNQNPQNPEGFAVFGYCQMKKNDLDAADKTLGQAIQAGSLSPDAGYFVALFQSKKDKFKEARDTLEKVMAQERGFIYKKEAVALLTEVKAKAPPEKDAPKTP